MSSSNLATNELLVILDIARRLSEQRLVQPMMVYVATTVFELVHAERCLIVLFAKDGTPIVEIAQDRKGEVLGTAPDEMSRSILERVRTSMSPLVVNDALEDPVLRTSRSVRNLRLRSVMCAPLISYGQAIGAIYVENRSARNQFRDENLVPLVLLSHQVVVALENARAYEALEIRIRQRTHELESANAQLVQQAAELREQSYRDSLTSLYNRRYASEHLRQQFEIARRYKNSLSVACIDIDNFKQVNDKLFHAGGDQVLVMVAQVLQTSVRQADTIARFGGEEFVLIMPETSVINALVVCERLRENVEHYDWSIIAPELRVTVSIGVADNSGSSNADELLRLADTRLYRAKTLGKNQVVLADGVD